MLKSTSIHQLKLYKLKAVPCKLISPRETTCWSKITKDDIHIKGDEQLSYCAKKTRVSFSPPQPWFVRASIVYISMHKPTQQNYNSKNNDYTNNHTNLVTSSDVSASHWRTQNLYLSVAMNKKSCASPCYKKGTRTWTKKQEPKHDYDRSEKKPQKHDHIDGSHEA